VRVSLVRIAVNRQIKKSKAVSNCQPRIKIARSKEIYIERIKMI